MNYGKDDDSHSPFIYVKANIIDSIYRSISDSEYSGRTVKEILLSELEKTVENFCKKYGSKEILEREKIIPKGFFKIAKPFLSQGDVVSD